MADECRQSFDDRRHAVHRQRRVQLQSATSAAPHDRAQAAPVPPGVPRSRPLEVDEAEAGKVGAAVTEVGEVQLIHRLQQ